MTKLDNFKDFVKQNPNLITYVKNNQMTWQKFYEIYDLYGEDEKVWNEYLKSNDNEIRTSNNNTISRPTNWQDLINAAKNIDVGKVQNGITSLQKALGLFSDLFIKDTNTSSVKDYQPRPIYRKFDD